MTRQPQRYDVVKDALLFVTGLSGIAYQTVIGPPNVPLLLVFVSMVGTPGLTNLLSLLRNGSLTESSSSSPRSAGPRSDSGTHSQEADRGPA